MYNLSMFCKKISTIIDFYILIKYQFVSLNNFLTDLYSSLLSSTSANKIERKEKWYEKIAKISVKQINISKQIKESIRASLFKEMEQKIFQPEKIFNKKNKNSN